MVSSVVAVAVIVLNSHLAQVGTLDCENGYYGDGCKHKCREQCLNSTCHLSVETGSATCSLGCEDGWKGVNCERRCPRRCAICNTTTCLECQNSTWYGIKCDTYCRKCKNRLCYSNGTCKLGCIGSFKGPWCNSSCDPRCVRCNARTQSCTICRKGRFGVNCSKICSPGCKDEECSTIKGSCTHGCVKGRTGADCSISEHIDATMDEETTEDVYAPHDLSSVSPGTYDDTGSMNGDTTRGDISARGIADTDENMVTILIIASLSGLFVLASTCVIISFCCGGRKRSKQVPGKTRHRHEVQVDGMYEEIRDCDVTSARIGNDMRDDGSAGYLTPRSASINSHQHGGVIENSQQVCVHTNQGFTGSRTTGRSVSEVNPTRCAGPRRTRSTFAGRVPTSDTATEMCTHHQLRSGRPSRSMGMLRPSRTLDKTCSNFLWDPQSAVVSPWQSSPVLRNKFTLNSGCEQVLNLMAEDSSSDY